jgi:hypothetical protein
MKIVDIKTLKGPNYWSIRRPRLIQMTLDLEEFEQRPTNLIPDFWRGSAACCRDYMSIAAALVLRADFLSVCKKAPGWAM